MRAYATVRVPEPPAAGFLRDVMCCGADGSAFAGTIVAIAIIFKMLCSK